MFVESHSSIRASRRPGSPCGYFEVMIRLPHLQTSEPKVGCPGWVRARRIATGSRTVRFVFLPFPPRRNAFLFFSSSFRGLDGQQLVIKPPNPTIGHGRRHDAPRLPLPPQSHSQLGPAEIAPLEPMGRLDQNGSQLRIASVDQSSIGLSETARGVSWTQCAESRQLLARPKSAHGSQFGLQHDRGDQADSRILKQLLHEGVVRRQIGQTRFHLNQQLLKMLNLLEELPDDPLSLRADRFAIADRGDPVLGPPTDSELDPVGPPAPQHASIAAATSSPCASTQRTMASAELSHRRFVRTLPARFITHT